MSVERVLLANPRGFCAGVEMAIKALAWMVRSFEGTVYCYHEIVHNRIIVERFEKQGVVFVDSIDEVPPGRPIMLSAHGSPPAVVAAARERGNYVVDSVCPLVTKVHHEVKVRAGKGYRIIYVGHEGHEEAIGTMAVAPDAIDRVESVAEVDALDHVDGPVALLAQTTLSHRDWEGVAVRVRERFPEVWTPGRSDLCFATTNRQAALMEMAHRCDAVIVIGSENSSNTRALAQLAIEEGCTSVLRINSVDELPTDDHGAIALHGVVGVTAGASAPEELVERVIEALDPADGVEMVHVTDEDEYFPPPRNIRELQTAIEAASTALLGGSWDGRPAMDDRVVAASDVLTALGD
ncbi:MAG: 4-hydroxy-3-methylbut-2-enyl diphosphate reductase [Ilumatobacter sp.]|nr:MAG: 4-hydroxy-3-methylbut-2-enyl diphosphate reductase [Ilumatobacter sp.]